MPPAGAEIVNTLKITISPIPSVTYRRTADQRWDRPVCLHFLDGLAFCVLRSTYKIRKPNLGYAVRMIRLESGERLPILVSRSGLPLFDPTLYVLAELRARNRSGATIEQALRAIMVA